MMSCALWILGKAIARRTSLNFRSSGTHTKVVDEINTTQWGKGRVHAPSCRHVGRAREPQLCGLHADTLALDAPICTPARFFGQPFYGSHTTLVRSRHRMISTSPKQVRIHPNHSIRWTDFTAAEARPCIANARPLIPREPKTQPTVCCPVVHGGARPRRHQHADAIPHSRVQLFDLPIAFHVR